MVDASFSRQRYQEDQAASAMRRRLLIPIVAGLLFVGAGLSLVWSFSGAAAPSPSREAISSEILETAKGLQSTQQQAVDQLQVVQDQLVAQREETKRLSAEIAALTEKLNTLQVSAPPVSPPKSSR